MDRKLKTNLETTDTKKENYVLKQETITIPCGALTGTIDNNGNHIFKGIRYATAGRWEYPKPVTHWDGVYSALEFGNNCWQPEASIPQEELKKTFYYREFRSDQNYCYSEDCLFLNIWVPAHAKNAPVLLYIHGGGFAKGCGEQKPFRGEQWCQQGVILVTINYRLGPFGFCCLPQLAAEAGQTGNYALYDQIEALRWVKQNIHAFGGDPENITIMGQSAGAISIATLSISPLTKGLFSKAIMLSGNGASKTMDMSRDAADTYPFWEAVMQELGGTLDAMRQAPPEQLIQTVKAVQSQKGITGAYWPVIDGISVPLKVSQAVRQGKQHDIPYIVSTTSEDMMPILLFGGAKKWVTLHNAQKAHPAYLCYFAQPLPGDDLGSWHSSDLWYLFGSFEDSWRPFSESDRNLSQTMMGYIASFIRTGDPNHEDAVSWEPTTSKNTALMTFADYTARMETISTRQILARTIRALKIYQGDTIKMPEQN